MASSLIYVLLLTVTYLLDEVLLVTVLQRVRIDVMTSIGSVNYTISGVVENINSASVPDEGIVSSVVGWAAGTDGCFPPTLAMPTANQTRSSLYSPFADSFVALMQRNKCNFVQTVKQTEAQGFNAVIIYDNTFMDTLPGMEVNRGIQNLTIPAIYIKFVDGYALFKKFQYFTGAYIVITANAVNSSISSATMANNGVTSTPSSDVANVLLGFIPAVSYVCIVLSVILIIIARRFIHCSLFVVYKMAMHHNPKVAPTPVARTESKSDVSSISRCTICLDEFKPTDLIHAILPCQHVFHQMCIDQWLRKGKLVCPLCRRKITLKKIIRHVFLSHEAQHKGHVFVIPMMCRPSAVSDSTGNMQATYPAQNRSHLQLAVLPPNE